MRKLVMSNTKWAEICCMVPVAMADPLADFLLELTGNGVSIDNRIVDTFNVEELTEEPEKSVKGYALDDEHLEQVVTGIREYLEANGPSFNGFCYKQPVVVFLREEDWSNSWKANFKPTRIGSRLVMKPSWEPYEAGAGDIVLELDPGMAFGTGTHATTRLCLEALERVIFDEGLFTIGRRALDVGCGSGVLGIAAALFGAGPVVSIDIDPIAVLITGENAIINKVDDLLDASATPLHAVSGEYAIVLANILAEELVKLGEELSGRVMKGGCLILSGILIEQEQFVIDGYSLMPLTLHRVIHQDEWCCLVYQKER
jgi:ribosomal protein L11 methyltransferase